MAGTRNVPPKVARARSVLGGRAKVNAPPELIEAARADLAEANAEAKIREMVAAWPPLSESKRAELACILLAPVSGDA